MNLDNFTERTAKTMRGSEKNASMWLLELRGEVPRIEERNRSGRRRGLFA